MLLGASDEPGAVVVLVDGTPLGASVGRPVVALGVVGVVVWARAGAAKTCEYVHYEDLVHDAFLFVAPRTANLRISSWFLEQRPT